MWWEVTSVLDHVKEINLEVLFVVVVIDNFF